jgi:amidase
MSSLNPLFTPEKYAKGLQIIRKAAKTNGIDKILAEHDIDVIIGHMEGRMTTIASAAGCPAGTMPLGYSKVNGRPFGACIISAAGNEDKILRVMSAWDATMPKRKPPQDLVETRERGLAGGKSVVE